ncbi:MAG: adenylate/guanylate cyclase domain-containing protein [Reyranella sp.]|uniref:adenylate/guanylate cyclase domain-containing protein n=1 Tax=Reyranella sp. TaxID=1929291 RepID=UPI0011FCC0A2|nr:adenylate/guanylate cyclase domain-containing protein [Reyranella sp.]TAJ39765.1 MAG: adenylate/guanylate cyclase domain-containing protein [Reyranella sp.]
MSAVTLDGADARLRIRLREEEHNGSLFAFRGRLVALGLVALWLLFAAGPMRVGVGACVAMMASAWLVHAARATRYAKALLLGVTLLDVTVITMATLVPIPGAPDGGLWLTQVFGRRTLFLYLVIYLTASALSYSARTVILTGAASLVALVGSFVWTVLDVARGSGVDLLAAADPWAGRWADLWPTARPLFARLIGPGFVTPEAFLIQQLIFMTICTGFIAVAVWRARAHLGRTLLAEGERNNLARYFSPNLVDRLAGAEHDLEAGRESKATVLFVDIVGFTRLMEGVPPQLTINFLRAFHEHMAECIFRHGGTLDKFIGDGVMATFGTPDSQPDDEARALGCARDMVQAVEDWNRGRRMRGLPPVRISVGVHVGPVLMGAIGSRNRLEYSAVGDTVNVASRLEHLSRAHDALIVTSAETLSAASELAGFDAARFRGIGPVQVPGRAQPVEVFIVPAPSAP